MCIYMGEAKAQPFSLPTFVEQTCLSGVTAANDLLNGKEA